MRNFIVKVGIIAVVYLICKYFGELTELHYFFGWIGGTICVGLLTEYNKYFGKKEIKNNN